MDSGSWVRCLCRCGGGLLIHLELIKPGPEMLDPPDRRVRLGPPRLAGFRHPTLQQNRSERQ